MRPVGGALVAVALLGSVSAGAGAGRPDPAATATASASPRPQPVTAVMTDVIGGNASHDYPVVLGVVRVAESCG